MSNSIPMQDLDATSHDGRSFTRGPQNQTESERGVSSMRPMSALPHPSSVASRWNWKWGPLERQSVSLFLFGLLNNSLYVVILTAALELLPKGVPTGVVAFANIAPALVAKAVWPYLLRGKVRYAKRIWSCVAMSLAGILVSFFSHSLDVSSLRVLTFYFLGTPTLVSDRCSLARSLDATARHLIGLLLIRPRRADLPPAEYTIRSKGRRSSHWMVLEWNRCCWPRRCLGMVDRTAVGRQGRPYHPHFSSHTDGRHLRIHSSWPRGCHGGAGSRQSKRLQSGL